MKLQFKNKPTLTLLFSSYLWESKALVYEDRMVTGILMSIAFMWIDV